uniref:Uncharacterized protein n=1 Tax=Oryza nivara TaxID=4536 RepID=A0A0E0G415_ORYNI
MERTAAAGRQGEDGVGRAYSPGGWREPERKTRRRSSSSLLLLRPPGRCYEPSPRGGGGDDDGGDAAGEVGEWSGGKRIPRPHKTLPSPRAPTWPPQHGPRAPRDSCSARVALRFLFYYFIILSLSRFPRRRALALVSHASLAGVARRAAPDEDGLRRRVIPTGWVHERARGARRRQSGGGVPRRGLPVGGRGGTDGVGPPRFVAKESEVSLFPCLSDCPRRSVSVGCSNDSHTVFPIASKRTIFPVSARFRPTTRLSDVFVDQTREPSKSRSMRLPSLNWSDALSFTGRDLLAVHMICGMDEVLKAGLLGSPTDTEKMAKRKSLQGAVQMKPHAKNGLYHDQEWEKGMGSENKRRRNSKLSAQGMVGLCSLFKWKQGNFHQERDIPHDFSRRTHQLGASVSGNWVPL